MKLLELTLPTPAENLALDEALLDEAEATNDTAGVLRIWESPQTMVVIGRSSKFSEEVDLPACQALGIPALRRVSGGAAIVAGPGCLMYAVVLSYERFPQLRLIDEAHQFVLGRLQAGLKILAPGAEIAGISDLAIHGRKFSGNSLRCKRSHLLYHGTLLYDFPLEIVQQVLRTPPRQPDYRSGRTHADFVMNLPAFRDELTSAIIRAWDCGESLAHWPQAQTARLVAEKYSHRDWHQRL